MKLVTLLKISCLVVIIGITLSKKTDSSLDTKIKSKKSLRGEDGKNSEAYTYFDGRQETGMNFALGSNGGYVANPVNGFKKVPLLDTLPPKTPIPRGPITRPDELPSTQTYYDGEMTLNSVKINCKFYKDPSSCVHQASCGWCHAKNSCIAGNNLDALEGCPRSQYQFSFPNGQSTAQRIVNNEIGGLNIRTFERN